MAAKKKWSRDQKRALKRIFPSKKPWNFQYYPIFQLVARTWHALGVATKSPQIHIDLNGIC